MNKEDIQAKLQDLILKLSEESDVDKLNVAIAKTASYLALQIQSNETPVTQNPPLVDIFSPINNILGDLKPGEQYFDKVASFVSKLSTADNEQDIIDITTSEILNSGWSIKIDVNSSGKEISLVNGQEILSIGKSLLSGNPMNAQNLIVGIVGKFEKEVFGFSVVDTIKDLESLGNLLLSDNPADYKLSSTLTQLDNLLETMSGSRLTPTIKTLLSSAVNLAEKNSEYKTELKKAVVEFTKDINGVLQPPVPETTQPPVPSVPSLPTQEQSPTRPSPQEEEKPLDPALQSALEFEEAMSEDFDYIQ